MNRVLIERAVPREDPAERLALSHLPERLRRAAERTAGDGEFEEIRLRAGGLLTLTAGGRTFSCGIRCTPGEVEDTVASLCGGSLYAQAGNIREGVIVTESGIRAGVSGRAVTENGTVAAVRDLTSVSIRVPHPRPGAADALLPAVLRGESVLVWSPPGYGKTTVLRELIRRVAAPPHLRRVAVIDTRYELWAEEAVTADYYRGFPRAAGMEAAVRTLSPELIVCDEIAGSPDCGAVRAARSAGVAVAASVHAGTEADFGRNEGIGALLREGCFGVLCGIGPDRKLTLSGSGEGTWGSNGS